MTPQDRDELLVQLGELRQAERGGVRAPDKPLLLLYALARVQAGESRLVAFADAERALGELLADFGPPRPTEPRFPFWHLQRDGLWDIPEREELQQAAGGGRPTTRALRAGAHGGLPEGVDRMVREDPELLRHGAHALLDRHFEPSLHGPICSALGLDTAAPDTTAVRERRKRDRAFRQMVLEAYSMRCAMCGWNVYLGRDALGLEAAHVFWHTLGGPDELSNGLCLCAIHHLALDRGALGIDTERRVLVSQALSGAEAGRLHELGGRLLEAPQPGNAPVHDGHAAWHREQVFRHPARG